jgi:hypothetical protein
MGGAMAAGAIATIAVTGIVTTATGADSRTR